MNKRKLFRILRRYGWSVEIYNIDFRIDDCLLYHDKNELLLKLVRNDDSIYLSVVGDIRIYGKREGNEFIAKGSDGPRGKLTYYLRKYGNWENNNWFEIVFNENWDHSETSYSLWNAIDIIMEHIE